MESTKFRTGDLIRLIDDSYVLVTFPSDEVMDTGTNWMVDCVPCNKHGEPEDGFEVGVPTRTEDFAENLGEVS